LTNTLNTGSRKTRIITVRLKSGLNLIGLKLMNLYIRQKLILKLYLRTILEAILMANKRIRLKRLKRLERLALEAKIKELERINKEIMDIDDEIERARKILK